MTRKKRKNSKSKSRGKPPAPFRSWLEYDFHVKFPDLPYEEQSFSYVSRHLYTPDFESKDGKIWVETKGRFRDSREARKYLDIRECLFEGEAEIVFIFQDPETKMPNARRRKDGTYATMKEWADRHGFRWATIDTAKKDWFK